MARSTSPSPAFAMLTRPHYSISRRALISDSPRSPIQHRGICYFAKGLDSCKLFREETAPDRRALHQFGELMARVFGRAVPGIEVQEVARRHPRGPFGALQQRLIGERLDVADAEIRHRNYRRRN